MSQGARKKGANGELEFGRVSGGKKISNTGKAGADVKDHRGELWEVKRRKKAALFFYDWVAQALRQGGNKVAYRADRHKWLVIMTYEDYEKERKER